LVSAKAREVPSDEEAQELGQKLVAGCEQLLEIEA
jgi:hypothetical protein